MDTLPKLAQGDLIEYVWYDILIDETGDPSKARLLRRRQFGLYLRLITDVASGIPCLVTASGQDEDDDAQPQSGWQAVPLALVTEIRKIKLPRRKKNVGVQGGSTAKVVGAPDAGGASGGGAGVREI